MRKKTDSIIFKLAVIFFVFTLLVLAISAQSTYQRQLSIYKQQCETNVRAVGHFLENLILADSEAFKFYQDYYVEHYDEIDIPYDFDEYQTAQRAYQGAIAKYHPDQAMGEDLSYSEMTPEAQEAYFIFLHEYWVLTFEEARSSFNLPYTYYLYITEHPENYDVMYMIDGERTLKDGTDNTLYLGDTYTHDFGEYETEWAAWFTGEKPEGFQVWDNEWGHTYAYYTPLVIDGKKMGLIGTEVDVADFNHNILINTLYQIAGLAVILVLGVICLLLIIHLNYVSKVIKLEGHVKEYSSTKDSSLADTIRSNVVGHNELVSLALMVADTITELGTYMKNLVQTRQELSETKEKADAMSELAHKDALTGIRNKTAYDNEIRLLDWTLSDGAVQFGIAVVDLNDLKTINDTYGHENGNIAIKKLCRITCETFSHSPVFRIGGDEFAIILKNNDYENIEALIVKFYDTTDSFTGNSFLQPWECTSAAIGYALFDPAIDSNTTDVFNRADAAMYEKKRQMKGVR